MIPDLLTPLLAAAVGEADVDPVSPATSAEHGDYQWNGCFKLAKTRKMAPRALAEQVVAALREAAHPAIAAAEVAGPGFVNLRLAEDWLADCLHQNLHAATAGLRQDGAGRVVVVDYSSPNVAKRMHVGHMRSTQIGDALARLYRASGWQVVADNHIGDWGTQFGKLIVAWHRWRDDAAFADDAIGELERLYVLFGEKAKEDPGLDDEARAETARLQRGDPENQELWLRFLRVSMAEFEALYARMGVRFDEVLGESAYRERTEGVVTRLLGEGLAEPSDGAIIVRFDKQGRPAPGQVPDKRFEGDLAIIQKRDGAANYTTTDLACVLYREERWAPERIVYVTDLRQQLHFRQLFAIARAVGVRAELVHAWFGMLVLPEGSMSTRKGNVVRLIDLLDEAVRRARAVVEEKSPELDDTEKDTIADAVGVGAIRWADLSQNPQSNISFTWERMLAMEGSTAPYLLYAHARAVRILARAGEAPDLDALAVEPGLERELLLQLLRYPEAVAAALRAHGPHLVCERLYGIAEAFNRFYHTLPVLEGGEARPRRLALVEASRRVLRHGLETLGLRVLDRM